MNKGVVKFTVCNIIIAVIMAFVLGGCFLTDEARIVMSTMTLREKVGQIFIVEPESLKKGSASVDSLTEEMIANLEKYPVGGVIMFANNIVTPEQITKLNADFQSVSEIPLFISVDEEGGNVARLARNKAFNLPKYESAAAVGASGNAEDAFNMGKTIGTYLDEYGFNMDFAPVADVNTNPNNTVIGKRAFSSDPVIAAAMAESMANGFKESGVIPVYKHFPGHGDTAQDSHKEIAISNKTQKQMESCEWLTFKKAGEGDCIMVGHIAVPEITGDMTPATMSFKVVTEILRNLLGFNGLIITDSLEMNAITDDYTSAEAAVAAFNAGCDILLMPNNLPNAFNAVLKAVENGTISEKRLNESVYRILSYKFK